MTVKEFCVEFIDRASDGITITVVFGAGTEAENDASRHRQVRIEVPLASVPDLPVALEIVLQAIEERGELASDVQSLKH